MSRAFADPVAPRTLAVAPERHVAVIPADGACRDVVGSLLAHALSQWAGAVAVHGDGDLADGPPDAIVLVMDSAAPAAMATLRRIRGDHRATPLVVVASDDRRASMARQALNAGADAFVRTDDAADALAPAIDAVLAGLVCAPRAARRLVAKPTFSHREKEVLELLVEGLTNRQIAGRLYLAESTVKTHVASAFAKLGVRSRKDAVALLLDPDEGLAATALPPA